MNRWILNDLPWHVDLDDAMKRLRIPEDDADDFVSMFHTIVRKIHPVFYFGRETVESNDGHRVVIGGQTFVSRVLAVNLKNMTDVYPYVVTSGREAYEYARSIDDEFIEFWAHQVCEMALTSFRVDALKAVKQQTGLQNLSSMNPGSIASWPIDQQRPLFDLLGSVYENTGVELTPSYLMVPVKSGSGILFPTEKHFANCMLCPRDDCPNRRAPFDPNKFAAEYGD